jgi:adenylate cyclase class 2
MPMNYARIALSCPMAAQAMPPGRALDVQNNFLSSIFDLCAPSLLPNNDSLLSFLDTMPPEIEIKLRIVNPKSFLRTLAKLGAKPISPRVHERNLIFDTPDGGLAKHGQLLRIRTESPAAPGTKGKKSAPKSKSSAERHLLTFKSPPEQLAIVPAVSPYNRRHKVREELETVLTDASALQKIFEGLGLRGWFRYEKFRTPYKLSARHKWAKDLLIDYDETPIGIFIELEGPHHAIDQAASLLGFHPRDFITKNYLVLYVDDCKRQGVSPSHMLFPNSK